MKELKLHLKKNIFTTVMIQRFQISASADEIGNTELLKDYLYLRFEISKNTIQEIFFHKKSIDARKATVKINVDISVYIDELAPTEGIHFSFQNVRLAQAVAIIGAGPAGLFAALQLIELGIKPIIFERGKEVKNRRRDLANMTKHNIVNPESNYCFGEGGAGTYSDGKLYTRSSKRGDVERILKLFVYHGADKRILYESHPHIGTNQLPQIIEAMRKTILEYGGEIYFEKKITDIILNGNSIQGIVINENEKIKINQVILATGHSARDIFHLLERKNIFIEAKPFALGVRIEHPQSLIDTMQYRCKERNEYLPPASYQIVEQVNSRGVFSFCMCPGGIIAPAATNEKEIVVNGWSPSKRNNPFANSGFVVSIEKKDFENEKFNHPLSALEYQRNVEQKCFAAGDGTLKAPAQRLVDFMNKKVSNDLPKNSYLPGTLSINLEEVLPKLIHESMRTALKSIQKKMPNYITNEAILVATESRTSSPVRIPRNKETLEHLNISGFYPCGEGAGYAGGIVSAAIDGENCAKACALKIL